MKISTYITEYTERFIAVSHKEGYHEELLFCPGIPELGTSFNISIDRVISHGMSRQAQLIDTLVMSEEKQKETIVCLLRSY